MGRGNFPGGDRNSGSDAPHPCSVLAGTVWREISASGGDGRWVRAARRLDNGAHYPRHHFYDTGAAAIRPGYSRETLIVSSLVGEIVVRFRAGDWNFSAGHELHHEYWRSERNRGDHAVCDCVSDLPDQGVPPHPSEGSRASSGVDDSRI